jgi:hypothetical protein
MCTISLQFKQMALLTWRSFSLMVMEASICKYDILDSSLVMSMLLPLSMNFPLATLTLLSLCRNTAKVHLVATMTTENEGFSFLQAGSLVFVFWKSPVSYKRPI